MDKCPFQIQTSVGGVGSTEWLTRDPLRLKFLPGHQTDESRTSIQVVVIGVDSYDVLVGSAVLYPMGFVLDYWGERVSFQPGWRFGDGRATQLPVSFFVSPNQQQKDGVSTLAAFATLSDITWP